jgi:hypothetical protein
MGTSAAKNGMNLHRIYIEIIESLHPNIEIIESLHPNIEIIESLHPHI